LERDGAVGEPAAPPYATRRERRAAERAAEAAALAPTAVELRSPPPVESLPSAEPPAIDLAQPQPEAARPSHVAGRRPRPAGRRSVVRGFMSIGCMAFAAALAIGMTVPPNVFGSAAPVVASELPDTDRGAAEKQQALAVDETVLASEAPLERDGYGGETFAQVEQARYQASGQGFAPGFVPTAGAIRWPFDHSVPLSSGFGYADPAYGGFHTGLDFVPGEGAPVSVIADGVVTWVGWDNTGRGYNVVVQHSVGGRTVKSIYGHMIDGSSTLYPGQVISVGTVVGLTGDTGWSYGAHLHLGIELDGEVIDPYAWLVENATDDSTAPLP